MEIVRVEGEKMDLEKRIETLEKRVAALEVQIQEQPNIKFSPHHHNEPETKHTFELATEFNHVHNEDMPQIIFKYYEETYTKEMQSIIKLRMQMKEKLKKLHVMSDEEYENQPI